VKAAPAMIDNRPLLGLLLAASATLSCADGSARFEAKYAPGFSGGPQEISLLGVYQDGRMSPDAWAEIGSKLSPLLGKKACDVAYDTKLRDISPELFTDLDKATQSEGITEEILDKLVPAAEGDTIGVVSLHIRGAAGQRLDGTDPTGLSYQTNNSRLPGSRSRQPPSLRPVAPTTWQLGEIRMIATLFSKKTHTTTARLTMIYTGNNIDEAIGKFVAKVGESWPGSTCRGWKWEAEK
jgi:hypothetical protein